MDDNKRRSLSKFLSKILRYKSKKYGVKFSKKGYCKLDELTDVVVKRFNGYTNAEEICYVLLNSKWNDTYRFNVWKGYVSAAYIPNRKERNL